MNMENKLVEIIYNSTSTNPTQIQPNSNSPKYVTKPNFCAPFGKTIATALETVRKLISCINEAELRHRI